MTRRSRSLAVAVSVVLSTWAVAACSNASNASTPCDRYSRAQTEQLLGSPVEKGLVTSTGIGCTYAGARSLLISIEDDVDDATWQHKRRLAAQTADLHDFGVDRFSYTSGDGNVHSAEMLAGSFMMRVLVNGPGTTEDQARTALATVAGSSS